MIFLQKSLELQWVHDNVEADRIRAFERIQTSLVELIADYYKTIDTFSNIIKVQVILNLLHKFLRLWFWYGNGLCVFQSVTSIDKNLDGILDISLIESVNTLY